MAENRTGPHAWREPKAPPLRLFFSPQKLCVLGRGRHWGHLVSELGGFGLEVLDLALAVLKLVEGRSLVHVFYPVAEHAVESPMFGLIHFSRQPFHNSNVAGAIGLRLRRWIWSSHHFVCSRNVTPWACFTTLSKCSKASAPLSATISRARRSLSDLDR